MWLSEGAADLLHGPEWWEVHSVFASSVNLRVEGRLLHVSPGLTSGVGFGCPFGVEIAPSSFASFRRRLGPAGSMVKWQTESRALVDPAGNRLFALPPGLLDRPSSTGLAAACRLAPGGADLLLRAADGTDRHSWFGGSYASLVRDPRMIAAARGIKFGHDPSAVHWLLGRGAGLTPSGDDVLVGLLGGCLATGQAAPDAVAELCALLERGGRSLTTDVSLEYLLYATRGKFAAPLRSLVDALTAGALDPVRVMRAANSLVGLGHTSGADALLGVLLALTVDSGRPRVD